MHKKQTNFQTPLPYLTANPIQNHLSESQKIKQILNKTKQTTGHNSNITTITYYLFSFSQNRISPESNIFAIT